MYNFEIPSFLGPLLKYTLLIFIILWDNIQE